MQLLLLNEDDQPIWLGLDEICMITASPKGPLFIAKDGTSCRYPLSMSQLAAAFGEYGYERLDRNVIGNLSAATSYDPATRKLVFQQEDPGAGNEELYATVSMTNVSKVKHLIIREVEDWACAYSAA
ncbi:hypothetical protein A8990_16719 [Paenibacillus taihuensis]|uniref:LytTr DNA-binding domain-containing protein n=1 Tax=Paenibacillus taihuensis TaxID=1156355 RepID=A0A3D9Q411_9BACL|nr:hypothetical protein [Paenibacillus taihuensis]REE55473.1 hypothetical protein A8990_16719 [Paenibacillus taihuensis]